MKFDEKNQLFIQITPRGCYLISNSELRKTEIKKYHFLEKVNYESVISGIKKCEKIRNHKSAYKNV